MASTPEPAQPPDMVGAAPDGYRRDVTVVDHPPRDLRGAGTPEQAWAAAGLDSLPRRRPPRAARVVVVAPHPDDEILGPGGTAALAQGDGATVHLVAVTDGEGSHPGRGDQLRACRPAESAAAATALGLRYASEHRLGLPDGAVTAEAVRAGLGPLVGAGDLVLAPWALDGHPDHDAVGAAAGQVAAAAGATLWSYLVWAWHWARPDGDDFPWAVATRIDLGPDVAARKADAAACFASQLEGPEPILPDHVLRRLLRGFEVVVPA